LVKHEKDFAARIGFTYTVLDNSGDVIGCVYIYPSPEEGVGAAVRSWVRASRAELDTPVYRTVDAWLKESWAFSTFDYAARQP
jgi:hypothetical protein